MIVSILNQKGGAGKTTISINLARAMLLDSSKDEKVLLIDSDPQGSARDWHAKADGMLLDVIGLDRPTLDKDVRTVAHTYDWIFIDGAPSLSSMAIAAIKCSDVILIPVQPSPYDLWATEDLVSLIKERIAMSDGRLKAAFVISRAIPNTILSQEIRGILEQYGLPVFQSLTTQRVFYSTTAAMGSTVMDYRGRGYLEASQEIRSMALELWGFSHD